MTADDGTAYAGLRVLELTDDPAGEMTGMHLAKLGARVTKVEPPGGVLSRQVGPHVGGVPDPDRSLAYWYYNAGKSAVLLDLPEPVGRAAFTRLLDAADVLLCSLTPPRLRELGLDLAGLSSARPGLVIVSITPFGLTGPWADRLASDLVLLATSGFLIMSGYDDHSLPPVRPAGNQACHTAASFAHIGLLLALIERQRSGRGGLVDVSVHEAAALTVELSNMYWHYPRVLVQRQTGRHAQPVPTQPALFRCRDGRYVYLLLVLADPKAWRSLVGWLDEHGLAADLAEPAYDDLKYRQENFAHVQSILEVFFLLQEAETAFRDGQGHGLPIGLLRGPADLYGDEQLRAREFFVPVDQPGYGPVRQPRSPIRMSAYATAARAGAPTLAQAAAAAAGLDGAT